ncbi:hypothetical protein OG562_20640 [Streptomyces sp. NBC_01275]|uniref:hypothetical protein n=1 Tax=Streptomyces sp. NBC_01275 TaxID=2903807 RepID=UPI002256C7B7|nr:hypothetical protein [Streptomyces sp. NBC_01275]MCX4763333.1 hypothetical protein [Streptomyces sp. NBC_01275]
MEWGTLAVAALGALFGVGTTLITDVFRSRREKNHQWNETKRAIYVRFLISLAQAHSRMTVAAFREEPGPIRQRAVHAAFLSDPQHSDAKSLLRELAIAAPEHIYQAAVPVYEQLRLARDIIASGPAEAASVEYQRAIRLFFNDLESLERLMRNDVQPPASR